MLAHWAAGELHCAVAPMRARAGPSRSRSTCRRRSRPVWFPTRQPSRRAPRIPIRRTTTPTAERERRRRRRPQDHQDDRDQPDCRRRAGHVPARRGQSRPVDRAERPRERSALAERDVHLGSRTAASRTKWKDGTTVVGCSLGTLAVDATTSATITVTPLAGRDRARSPTPRPWARRRSTRRRRTTPPPRAARSPASADLAVTLTGPPTVDAGGTVTFHLGFANNGPSDATNIVFTNTLPAGLTLPQLPPGCTLSGATLSCHLDPSRCGSEPNHRSQCDDRPGRVSGAIFTQHATIKADQIDPIPANDTASSTAP